jgi:hypothetical protein
MSTIVLDTLEYASKLKAGGFNEQQAETQARALAEVLERQMATKAEVSEHENLLRRTSPKSNATFERPNYASKPRSPRLTPRSPKPKRI